ncbi:MAG: sulfate permease [Ardenticatenaceae bacterium]|nr:sulfate permease [Ardenticatenaceae bacterium]MCB9446573.1 sulfate permease [Ardenticatenaceae bacterium]
MSRYLQQPYRLFRKYDRANLRPDLVAGLTVAVIALPQAIAFAVIAELPPQMGLYTSIVGGIAGALWGASDQAHTGAANAISLLVASSLAGIASPGTNEYMLAAGLMAVMAGVFQLVMGLLRLGLLVNFVSHSVIIGFSAGAGVLIVIKQIGPLLGIPLNTANPLVLIQDLVLSLNAIHWPTAILGLGTILLGIFIARISPKLPKALLSIVLASVAVFVFHLDKAGVALIGKLPRELPPLAPLPLLDFQLMARLSTGALAVGAIGLVQTIALARSVAAQTGQRLDSNQEFVGQGFGNIVSGLFSGYAVAASFSRTVVNYKTGAKSQMSVIFSSLFLMISILLLAPLTAYLPMAALAGVIIPIAYGLIDRVEISRIWKGTKGDASIMVLTLLGTLFMDIQFAVLLGIGLSLVMYILRTSTPRVHAVIPDSNYKHFVYQPGQPPCPQLGVVDILGDLYFGAVNHVEELILTLAEQQSEQRFLLVRMNHVNHCDFSGIHMLEGVVRAFRDRGGDVFFVRINFPVWQLMQSTGFDKWLGADHFLAEDEAIDYLFHRVLDPVICIYECPLRVFKECQNLPKRIDIKGIPREGDVPSEGIFMVSPQALWRMIYVDTAVPPPYVIDVREPREFKRGHVPTAHSVPLPSILLDTVKLPADRQIVIVCRSSRRSRRAAYVLQQMGVMDVAVLDGGMLAWEATGLLEAVETFATEPA